MLKKKISELLRYLSPVMINQNFNSISIGLSNRFLLFRAINELDRKISDEPYLNFISVLKFYKILGRFLHGPIQDLYRDRNKLYFQNFFMDESLYKLVRDDIEWVYAKNKEVKMTITKRGLIIYDNYRPNSFNVLLLTIHSGTWMPEDIEKTQIITRNQRLVEEDVDSHKLYCNLVLENNGIWIDNKSSRFTCDYNRAPDGAVIEDNTDRWVKHLWKQPITKWQRRRLLKGYAEFYFTLGQLIDTYRFNIIFDAHSMRHAKGRPNISFGTKYIPSFYMPIVRSIQRKLINIGYHPVALNNPFHGGYILKWLNKRFPDIFICSMEVNKRLYMSWDRRKSIEKRLNRIAKDISTIFDISEDTE
ncbi:MAG: N-formylglutamate amidohydrolase [archaeon]